MRRLPPLFRARFGGANVQPAIHHDRINADDFTSQGGAQAQRNFGFSAAAWTDNGDDREFHEGLILTGKAKAGSRWAPRALASRHRWRGYAGGRWSRRAPRALVSRPVFICLFGNGMVAPGAGRFGVTPIRVRTALLATG